MFEIAEIKKADGSSVYYTDDGEGIPLLFIHGWLMCHRVWSLQAPLSAGFRVITLDLPGHGKSNGARFSYNDCCDDIALLCDQLRLDRVIMVGWSMGVQLALKSFRDLKEFIAGMVLVSGTPHFCSSCDFLHGIAPSEARMMALRIRKNYSRAAEEFIGALFSQQEIVDMRALSKQVVGDLPLRDTALSALDELIHSDMRADLPFISVPVLLVHGIDDKICLPEASRFMAEVIPAAELELIPSSGHAPFLTNPETFNRILSGFVQVVYGRN